jgi:hypothetical protein
MELAKTRTGMTIERPADDVILVRYAPIENYQREGNLQFVKNPVTGNWDMQYDYWNCPLATEVKDELLTEYQKAEVEDAYSQMGFMTTDVQKTKTGYRLVATHY